MVPGEKKGKLAKRLEREELMQQQKKALKLKARNIQQQQQQQQQQVDDAVPAAAANNVALSPAVPASAAADASAVALGGATPSKCNTCGGFFPDKDAFRAHFKSEWHRLNLTRKMKGMRIIPSEEEFLSLSLAELMI